jgi:CheY-like chemotaxis protein
MPGGMNGRELAEEATRRLPKLKVLFTTGYTRNAIVHHGRLDANVHMIGKPYLLADLSAKLRELLDS